MMRAPRLCRSLGWFLALLVACGIGSSVRAEKLAVRAAAEAITANELKRHVDVLADDSFEGREGGSRGGRAAGGYLASELQKHGLKGLGDGGSFFQAHAGQQRNILALLEGSDPELKHQYIILGAHYDHVGYGTRANSFGPTGYIHNGADDNASGVAGLIEIVKAFAALPERPKRSILFALWDGEEKGLLGSRHWVTQPTVPLKNVVLYINLDMIGRLRKSRVEVYGTRTSYRLRQLASRSNEGEGLWLDFTWEMKDNSDHYPFFERSIPAMMFHTGLHENYHRPSDDAHLINHEGIQRVSRLLFTFLYELANDDRPLKFRSESRREDPAARRVFEMPLAAPTPRFGLTWREPTDDNVGFEVVRVTRGMPAERAGLRVGDRLLKFGGRQITKDLPLKTLVLAARSPVEVEVQRAGEENTLTLPVQLQGSPTRLGIAWRDDAAEPGTVLLTRVTDGSAAHAAGLKVRDRIYEIGGQTFADSQQFHQLATTLPSPIEVLLERSGTLQRVQLELPE